MKYCIIKNSVKIDKGAKKKDMENKDRIIKFLAYEGKVAITTINSTYLVEQARKTHDLSPVATAALGRLLTMTAMMGVELKGIEDKITIQLRGNGPLGTMVTSSNMFPKVKGYVTNPLIDLPLRQDGKLDVGTAVGKEGFLNVIRDIGMKEPYIGMIPLVSGEIAEDFASYFATSEQKPTVCALGVLVDCKGVKASGGYLLTLMPDATEEIIAKIEETVKQVDPISTMLDQELSLEEIAKKVSGDDHVKVIEENIIPVYECDCSKEKIETAFMTLGKTEIQEMIKQDGKAEATCHFCNEKYMFSKEDLENILEKQNSDPKESE